MGFSEEREIVEINNQEEFEELDQPEDVELHIKGIISIREDLEITDCNILFGPGGRMNLKGGKTEFNDCEIAFPGNGKNPVIIAEGGDIAFDSCNIYQLEGDGKKAKVFISSDVNQKTIELSNCKVHDMKGVFIQSNGTNVYVEKTEVYNFINNFVNIQKGSKGFSPAFELIECSFKNCDKSKSEGDYIVKIGHIMSGKIENCNFESCHIGCISANGNRWDDADSDGGKDSKDCPFIINNCDFKNCENTTGKYSFMVDEDKPVFVSMYNTRILDCKFYKCAGMQVNTQLSELHIENCEFKECKSEGPRDGVLSILVDVYEKLIYIKNCKFEKCVVDRESRNAGVIFLTSGFADKDQKDTVTIEKCIFRGCVGNEIRGIERDDGLFGRSVRLYIRKY